MADGIFQVRELAFSLGGEELLIECGATMRVDDDTCGQPTAKGFALPYGDETMTLGELKAMLETVLDEIRELESRGETESGAKPTSA